jgi:hypothetical protein
LAQGILHMGLFDGPLAEVAMPDGQRYILRRNPARADEIAASRDSKYAALSTAVDASNEFLATHFCAKPNTIPHKELSAGWYNTQLKKLQSRAEKLRVNGRTKLDLEGHAITIEKDADALTKASRLDGCYVLKTDFSPTVASKDIVHDRYKDLALVEWAFRASGVAARQRTTRIVAMLSWS